jgi:hypothetical protein
MWWARSPRPHVEAEHEQEPAAAGWLVRARTFLRPSLSDHRLPDQASEAKARALLERALKPEQLRDLITRRYFYVKGRRLTYRIREGHSGNIEALDPNGCVVGRLCAYPMGHVPISDVMLAQKLWIETDENVFLKKAAPHPLQYY